MNTENTAVASDVDQKLDSQKNTVMLAYALQAASYIFGITFFAAVIIAYVKRGDVSGSYLESHYRWQIRSFWFAILWSLIGLVTVFVVVGYFLLIANAIWFLYRIIKGWMRLNEGQPMY